MAGPDLLDDAADPDGADAGDLGLEDDRVVELQVRALADADPELERGGVLGAEDQPDRLGLGRRREQQAGDVGGRLL